MASRRPKSQWWLLAAATTMAAACSLDFDSFNYPDEVVTSSSSSSSSSGDGGTGGLFTSSSSSSSGMGGAGASGGAGGIGGAGANGGMGGMGGCADPGDCPTGAECEQATCANNMCGLESAPIGTTCVMGGNICDGMGMCTTCQTTPVAAAGAMMCPAICSSCNDTDNDMVPDECVFDCTGGGDPCPGIIACPAGFSCDVTCNQNNCSNFTINCPAGEACAVSCDGQQQGTAACAGAIINCDQSSVCDLDCTNNGCNNSTTMVCGSGKCTGNCDNNAIGTLACGNSCWCDGNSCNTQ